MSKRLHRRKVAVVEDHDDIRFLLELWLAQHFEVAAFETGEELLARLESLAPDLVVMDLNLHGKYGLQIAATIRQPETRWSRLPVLFLTGMPRSGLESVLENDHTAFLSKPLQLSYLREAVDRLLDEAAGHRVGRVHGR